MANESANALIANTHGHLDVPVHTGTYDDVLKQIEEEQREVPPDE